MRRQCLRTFCRKVQNVKEWAISPKDEKLRRKWSISKLWCAKQLNFANADETVFQLLPNTLNWFAQQKTFATLDVSVVVKFLQLAKRIWEWDWIYELTVTSHWNAIIMFHCAASAAHSPMTDCFNHAHVCDNCWYNKQCHKWSYLQSKTISPVNVSKQLCCKRLTYHKESWEL